MKRVQFLCLFECMPVYLMQLTFSHRAFYADDHSRVMLAGCDDGGTDYINANYIDVR